MRTKRSKTKGVTLAELLVAVFILSVVIAPVLGMFMWSSQTSIKAYKISIASVIAEMRMEELVGTKIDPGTDEFIDNGFKVKILVENLKFDDLDDGFTASLNSGSLADITASIAEYAGFLRMVTVTVYDHDDTVLCTQRNIINTATNGFVS